MREGQDKPQEAEANRGGIVYGVEDVPSPHLCFLFALQQALLCLGSTLSIPFILTELLCSRDNADARAQLLCITMFMCGVATILQTTTGIRLGIIQGGSHTFIAPIVAMMSIQKFRCPDVSALQENATVTDRDEVWQFRLREIQGNLMLASVTQVVLGCTGLMGFFLRFIGPLTIAPTISLIGLSLTAVAADFNKIHWGISILTLVVMVASSLYLGGFQIPFPAYSREKKCHVTKYPFFQLMPVLISIIISWILCHVLTVTDVFPNNVTSVNYYARSDARLDVLDSMPWFYFPYPFQFGMPTFSAAGYVGMLAATLSSVIESIGDYFACARLSGAQPPPIHALNRGIATEGFSSIISGMVGAGHATTSYSGNIGAIGITKVASRRVFQVAGLILLVCGIIGKFGAVLTLIPDPIIGGSLTVVFGMVAAVGISVLQFTDLGSTRNLTIVAVSIILGLMVPQWLQSNPGAIDTGNRDLDQVLEVLLGTAMFVGGILGFILDNTVPGTPEERGLVKWRENTYSSGSAQELTPVQYEWPYITKYIEKLKCCSYFPVSPSFKEIPIVCCGTRGQITGTEEEMDPENTNL
ncbi:solute carrier family 23 member 2-like [Saccostrea echinata]|uniref:solute carrier family 23 member 2-like n=1 Tax=Saccostrea echinata TaxID=191078 RepID=UPI002A837AC9|nr:solute carrier family 23 member 2-like [Saccostrea echinata]